MLPRGARLRRSQDFSQTVRHGVRAGRPLLVVHLDLASAPDAAAPSVGSSAEQSRPGRGPRAGFVVSKAVGGSVARHAVARRLRHLVRDRLAALPPDASLVVRALPGAADATSAVLGAQLDDALASALHKASRARDAASAGAPR